MSINRKKFCLISSLSAEDFAARDCNLFGFTIIETVVTYVVLELILKFT